ncbi:hypothetical protein C483_08619 [Natrialba hulunbeirensis JCM 10989]|uniref:Uncharacterized protein n=1 Tax=Natrialba hulunbeirensis JCM 10989 TaxID=1227493 RepID=M0A2J9_9EURY|nr:hypothetical protein [Natrialba hulunbeirensis]ELY92077.1 hypothetical protein C483_08619 [Natrialba hulunbeirensis JCM 10989]
MSRKADSPATVSSWSAICFAGVGWSVAVPYSIHATALSTVGWLVLGLALLAGDRTTLTTGAGVLVLGGFVAAGNGASISAVLVAVTASILAWDSGQNAISIGRQLGPSAPTVRAELGHILASLTVGSALVLVGLVTTRLAGDVQPLIAVVLFLLAASVVTLVLGPEAVLDVTRFGSEDATSDASER